MLSIQLLFQRSHTSDTAPPMLLKNQLQQICIIPSDPFNLAHHERSDHHHWGDHKAQIGHGNFLHSKKVPHQWYGGHHHHCYGHHPFHDGLTSLLSHSHLHSCDHLHDSDHYSGHYLHGLHCCSGLHHFDHCSQQAQKFSTYHHMRTYIPTWLHVFYNACIRNKTTCHIPCRVTTITIMRSIVATTSPTVSSTRRAFPSPMTRLPTLETVTSTPSTSTTTLPSASTSRIATVPSSASITSFWLCSIDSYGSAIKVLAMQALNGIIHGTFTVEVNKAKSTRMSCFLVHNYLFREMWFVWDQNLQPEKKGGGFHKEGEIACEKGITLASSTLPNGRNASSSALSVVLHDNPPTKHLNSSASPCAIKVTAALPTISQRTLSTLHKILHRHNNKQEHIRWQNSSPSHQETYGENQEENHSKRKGRSVSPPCHKKYK